MQCTSDDNTSEIIRQYILQYILQTQVQVMIGYSTALNLCVATTHRSTLSWQQPRIPLITATAVCLSGAHIKSDLVPSAFS
jgi:hypothetical protein